MSATALEHVMLALRGGKPPKTPFTSYDMYVPQCNTERFLRNRGMCIVNRIASTEMVFKGVLEETCHYRTADGKQMRRQSFDTPHGKLFWEAELAGNYEWITSYLFKSESDFKAIRYLFNNAEIKETYASLAQRIRNNGGDSMLRERLWMPMQWIISTHLMSTNEFALQWYDNRDEIEGLYRELREIARTAYTVIAAGPLEVFNYGGNVIPQITGREIFEKFYIPDYCEAAEIMHDAGKLIGSHFDGENELIMDLIAKTPLDYIESYDPCCSPGIAEARRIFGRKPLWINWPSAWHYLSPGQIVDKTVGLIREAGDNGGFIIGISEDPPYDRWAEIMTAISDGIEYAAM